MKWDEMLILKLLKGEETFLMTKVTRCLYYFSSLCIIKIKPKKSLSLKKLQKLTIG